VIEISIGSHPSSPFDHIRSQMRPSGVVSAFANETSSHPVQVRPDASLRRRTVYSGSAGFRTTSRCWGAGLGAITEGATADGAEPPKEHAVSATASAVARGKVAIDHECRAADPPLRLMQS
jgi:hypothetical protein